MRHRPRRRTLLRIPTLAALLLLATCTEEHGPVFPGRTWITPTGQVTSSPPVLFVGAGDIANCSSSGDEATADLLDGIPGTVYAIGDNAYQDGSSSDRKSTRLNSSHVEISYAVFCLKKKKNKK